MTVQRSMQNTRQMFQKTKSPCHTIITKNIQNRETTLKAEKEKHQVTYKDRPIKITPDFSLKTLKASRFCRLLETTNASPDYDNQQNFQSQ